MSIALWCVLIAALMPYILTGIAKSGGRYDNADPRSFLQKLGGRYQRANSAHLNSFEAFPFFAAAVIVAEMKGAPRGTLDILAVVFIVARIGYAAAYIGNRPSLRSLIWGVGFVVTMAIFTLPLWR